MPSVHSEEPLTLPRMRIHIEIYEPRIVSLFRRHSSRYYLVIAENTLAASASDLSFFRATRLFTALSEYKKTYVTESGMRGQNETGI